MSVSMQGEKPPYVRFEYVAVEDRAASIREGRMISKDVAHAYIMPAGTRDERVKNAEEWLTDMRTQSEKFADKAYLGQWYTHFKRCYEEWQKGNEMPESGTPIRTCLMFKPSEIQAILAANIRTLEDLASANEQAMGYLGIGGRLLQQRAREIMVQSKNGASAEQITALKVEIDALRQQLEDSNAKVAAMQAARAAPVSTAEFQRNN